MNGECNIMKKSVTIAILTGVFTAFTVMCTLNNTEQLISDGVLRLHVIAHDNTDEEQELKLKVRDRILKEFNLNKELPIVLVFGGSQGAKSINASLIDIIKNKLCLASLKFRL